MCTPGDIIEKMILVALFLAFTAFADVATIQPIPVVPNAIGSVVTESPPQYFSDPDAGDVKSHQDDDVVKGTYSVVGVDGVNRIGDYTTDDLNRFNGVVREERAADELPTSTSSPSTVSEHDEQSSEPAKPSSVPAPEASHNSENLPQYNFTFNVSDPQKDVKSHQDDDAVEGSYSVVGVDGVKRIAAYAVDGRNGFNGVVGEERAADELPSPTSSPSTAPESHHHEKSRPKPSSAPAPEASHNSESLPQHNFAFNVSDPDIEDVKPYQDGDVLEGSYSVVGVDGVKRFVDDTSDELNRFSSVVREKRAADEPPPSTSSTPSTTPHHDEKSNEPLQPSSTPAPETSHNSSEQTPLYPYYQGIPPFYPVLPNARPYSMPYYLPYRAGYPSLQMRSFNRPYVVPYAYVAPNFRG